MKESIKLKDPSQHSPDRIDQAISKGETVLQWSNCLPVVQGTAVMQPLWFVAHVGCLMMHLAKSLKLL